MATTLLQSVPSGEVTLAWRSPYVSESLNKKAQAVGRGIIRGFYPAQGAGVRELRLLIDPVSMDSVLNGGGKGAGFDTLLTWRVDSDLQVTLPNDPGGKYFICFVPGYTTGSTTTPELMAYDEADWVAGIPESVGAVLICAATCPVGAVPVASEDIHFSGTTSAGRYDREIQRNEYENRSEAIFSSSFGDPATDSILLTTGGDGTGALSETAGSFSRVIKDGTQETGTGFLRMNKASGEDLWCDYPTLQMEGMPARFLSPDYSHKVRISIRYRTSANYTVPTVADCLASTSLRTSMWLFPLIEGSSSMAGGTDPDGGYPVVHGDPALMTVWPSFDPAFLTEFDGSPSTLFQPNTEWTWMVVEFDLSRILPGSYLDVPAGHQPRVDGFLFYMLWGMGWDASGGDVYLDIDRMSIVRDTVPSLEMDSAHPSNSGAALYDSKYASNASGLDVMNSFTVSMPNDGGITTTLPQPGGTLKYTAGANDFETYDWQLNPYESNRTGPVGSYTPGKVEYVLDNNGTYPTGSFASNANKIDLKGTLVSGDGTSIYLDGRDEQNDSGPTGQAMLLSTQYGSVRFGPSSVTRMDDFTNYLNQEQWGEINLRGDVHFAPTNSAYWAKTLTGAGTALVVGPANDIRKLSSTRKIKSDIQDSTLGLSEVEALSPRSFKMNSAPEVETYGHIAEEVAGVHRALAHWGPDHVYGEDGACKLDSDDKPILASDKTVPVDLNDRAMIAALVGAVKELSAKVVELEAEIAALK